MTDREIRKLSRKLNKGQYKYTFLILLFTFLSFIFFCIFPSVLIKITEPFKIILNQKDKLIYPSIYVGVLLVIFLIYSVLFSSINLGGKAWFTGKNKASRNKRLKFWFYPLPSIKAFKLKILMFFIKLFWTVVFLLPAAIAFAGVISLAYGGGIEFYLFLSLIAGGTILLITGLIFRFIIIQRYFAAPYLMASEPKLKPIIAIKQSKNLIEGHIFRIVLFKIKYLPSFILYPLIIPAIFLYPNYKQSCSLLAKEVTL